eukprot:TRINITY_DN2100_c0_g2_i1.p1 TRINITY_DN2100_c0_g2~~TRINITY_DN2100_c0_g2_i1.p1  ORF type:complete len:289 (+),score=27.33 TRINITY_DN2100_c0_g2_i1:449-1315(+)
MEEVENPFLALPAEITLHIASYVCNMALDASSVPFGRKSHSGSESTSSALPQQHLDAADANETAIKSAKLFALLLLDSNFRRAIQPTYTKILRMLDSDNLRRAKDLAAHFSSNLSIRFKHAWIESWIIGDDELYYTARFEMGVFRDPPHRHRVLLAALTDEEMANGMKFKIAYNWRPQHRVLLHYRFFICSQERNSGLSTLEAAVTLPKDFPLDGHVIDPQQFQEETWQASFHHYVGFRRGSLQGILKSAPRSARFEFWFEIIDGGRSIINMNKGEYYSLSVNGVSGY